MLITESERGQNGMGYLYSRQRCSRSCSRRLSTVPEHWSFRPVQGGGAVRHLIAGTDRRSASVPIASVLYRYNCRFSTKTLYEYAIENRPPAKPMARCWLQLSETTEWKNACDRFLLYRTLPRWGVPGSSSARSPGASWLSIGFYWRSIFPIENNGNFRPPYLRNGKSYRALRFCMQIAMAYGY